jgi:hypothetical protein
MKQYWIDETHGTYRAEEKFIRSFDDETQRKKRHLADLGVDGKITLNQTFKR